MAYLWVSTTAWLDYEGVRTLFTAAMAHPEVFRVTEVADLPVNEEGVFFVLQPPSGLIDSNMWDILSGPVGSKRLVSTFFMVRHLTKLCSIEHKKLS
ncbi:unnamed protein product [Microthlaspi erraticum]|uniref:Uncharacterized protein n=1 Tax=Microthlaspi erraticum TaxID=1685480 RepID=A0A6D2KWA1_9BRAS|nr:unnamed protein product [Microthlaspi erraticum]